MARIRGFVVVCIALQPVWVFGEPAAAFTALTDEQKTELSQKLKQCTSGGGGALRVSYDTCADPIFKSYGLPTSKDLETERNDQAKESLAQTYDITPDEAAKIQQELKRCEGGGRAVKAVSYEQCSDRVYAAHRLPTSKTLKTLKEARNRELIAAKTGLSKEKAAEFQTALNQCVNGGPGALSMSYEKCSENVYQAFGLPSPKEEEEKASIRLITLNYGLTEQNAKLLKERLKGCEHGGRGVLAVPYDQCADPIYESFGVPSSKRFREVQLSQRRDQMEEDYGIDREIVLKLEAALAVCDRGGPGVKAEPYDQCVDRIRKRILDATSSEENVMVHLKQSIRELNSLQSRAPAGDREMRFVDRGDKPFKEDSVLESSPRGGARRSSEEAPSGGTGGGWDTEGKGAGSTRR
jgi:hypothetical protein